MNRLALTALLVAVACGGSKPPVKEVMPPRPPAVLTLADAAEAPALTIRATPDTAVLRPVLERTLGRAGFRVLPNPELGSLVVNLSGSGAATSGSNEQGSTVQQHLVAELAVFADGRLVGEHRAEVGYTLFHERESETESFEQFNRRVSDAQAVALDFLASDLSNQLIGTVRKLGKVQGTAK